VLELFAKRQKQELPGWPGKKTIAPHDSASQNQWYFENISCVQIFEVRRRTYLKMKNTRR